MRRFRIESGGRTLRGGTLIATAGTATLDENDHKRAKQPFINGKIGAGQSVYWEQPPSIDEMTKEPVKASGEELVHMEAPAGILYNVAEQQQGNRVLVHLLNYTLSPDGIATFAKAPALGTAQVPAFQPRRGDRIGHKCSPDSWVLISAGRYDETVRHPGGYPERSMCVGRARPG